MQPHNENNLAERGYIHSMEGYSSCIAHLMPVHICDSSTLQKEDVAELLLISKFGVFLKLKLNILMTRNTVIQREEKTL